MRWFRWYRYWAVIVGQESGNMTRLPFVRFRRKEDAQRWCAQMNLAYMEGNPDPLALYGFEEIPWT